MDLDLTGLTEAELIDLNHRIVARLRALRLQRCRSTMTEFTVGDRVSFHPDCGHHVTGTIVRLNLKSITVITAEGMRWRVSPALLKIAVDTSCTDDPLAHVQATLIDLAARRHDRGKA